MVVEQKAREDTQRMTIKLLESPTTAAKMMDVSRATLYRLVAAGELPHIRIAGRLKIPVEGLRTWIEENTRNG